MGLSCCCAKKEEEYDSSDGLCYDREGLLPSYDDPGSPSSETPEPTTQLPQHSK